MAAAELSVAVLWHLHQPDYVDSSRGRAMLPWVRLHALFSYFDTLRVVEEVTGARAAFNVVPVLLRQLAACAAGSVEDEFLELARRDPGDLTEGERRLVLQHFFAFNHARRFAELPRLGELHRKRGPLPADPRRLDARALSDQEVLDLQVGFQLAWSGRTLREHELALALLGKGRDFTAGEKRDLLALQQEFLGGILPAYRKAAAAGTVEFSSTPFCHPILPLLCDTESAHEAVPDLPLPGVRFQRPGDAWHQVRVGLDESERMLGVRPAGMWPAEGSVSEEAVRIFGAEEVAWLGCDQDVLAASTAGGQLPGGGHFQPFRWGGDWAPAIFFRDKGLSDRIGFVYATWKADKAAADFVGHLERIRQQLPTGRFVVPVILDGENPWEGYEAGGVPFLTKVYRRVAGTENLRWTTFGEFLAENGDAVQPLERICAGSWIRNDFTTWIGHPEKNAGWERLHLVRNVLEERLVAEDALRRVTLPGSGTEITAPAPERVGPEVDTPLARAWRAMMAAEGSDWFWWYGDDHPTDFALEFDSLFRTHLSNVYRHLDVEPDPLLRISLLSRTAGPRVQPPRYPLRVVLDGRLTSYFEWLDAGRAEAGGGGSMHRTDLPVESLRFGAGVDRLFLLLEPTSEAGLAALAGFTVDIQLAAPVTARVSLAIPQTVDRPGRIVEKPPANRTDSATGAFDRVIEIGVPWSRLGVAAGQECEFLVSLVRGEETELVIPGTGRLTLRVPTGPDDTDDWLV